MTTRRPSEPSLEEAWIDAESADPEPAESARPQIDPLIGTVLQGTYRVLRLIAEGGMGRIYEARHVRIGARRFAVKVLRPELVSSSQIRSRFEREVEAIARVSHPGVLTVVDVGTTPLGLPFMVCEHLYGLDLLAHSKRFGALPNDRVVHMGCRIAEALEAAHAQGVIHRDIKPSNIFLLGAFEPLGPEWDRVKVIDFGLSRLSGQDDHVTEAGLVMGTPAYMSPEQARGARTDHRTDVYGVGAVLYAAATGVPPFREETPQQTLIAVMSRDPVRPRELNPAISEELELLIQRALSKQPEARHPSMSALRLELSNLEHAIALRGAGRAGSALPGAFGGVRARLVALASGALLLGLGAGADVVAALGSRLELGPGSAAPRLALAAGAGLGLVLGLRQAVRAARRIWHDTARVADALGRLRAPLLAALVVYALGSFALRLGEGALARWLPAHVGPAAALGDPRWGAVLALGALLAACCIVLHRSWWEPLPARRRWAWAAALAGGAALLGAGLAHSTSDGWRGLAARAVARTVPEGAALGAGPADARDGLAAHAASGPLASGPLASGGERPLTQAGSPDGGAPREADAGSAPSANAAPPSEPQLASRPPAEGAAGPARELATPAAFEPALTAVVAPAAGSSHENGAEPGAAALAGEPTSAAALREQVLEHARRISGLPEAVRGVERLLTLDPESAADPEVRRVLNRAAGFGGETSRAAFRLMTGAMGRHGPDLLYEILVHRPSLADKARYFLTRHRVRALFSPELAIAYDLRFAPSCRARLGLLERAMELGDQRTINELAPLVSHGPRCGQPGRSPCLELCEDEALQFSRAIDAIVRRLRQGERAASVN